MSLDEVIAITGLQVTNTEGFRTSSCDYRIAADKGPPTVSIRLSDKETVAEAEEWMAGTRLTDDTKDITGVGEDAVLHGELDIQGLAMAGLGNPLR